MHRLLVDARFGPLFFAQLFGAFNDNLLKSVLCLLVAFGTLSLGHVGGDAVVQLAAALLVGPAFVFSAGAGSLADRMPKARLVRWLKLFELVASLVAAVGFFCGSVPILLVSLALVGTQAALFGPVKYAIVPELVDERDVVDANALVEAATFVAILLGTVTGGALAGLGAAHLGVAALVVVTVALFGYVCACALPETPAPVLTSFARDTTFGVMALARQDAGVWRAIVAASFGWFAGAFFLSELPAFARDALHAGESAATTLMACFTLGVGAGSILGARASHGRIEQGLVPIGLFGMGLCGVDLVFARTSLRAELDVAGIGIAGGLFFVPLYATMQLRAAAAERSRILAANNVLNAAFMVAAALLAFAMHALVSSVRVALMVPAALALVYAALLLVRHRVEALRVVVRSVLAVTYRGRARGIANVPMHGPVLVVANHVSFIDAFVLGASCPRVVRFVMYAPYYDCWYARWFFDAIGAIPILPRREGEAVLTRAYDRIDEALSRGEAVCVFPEGELTRDGRVGAFRRGVERILARRPVPVVPVALRGLWGSFFSHANGPAMRALPRRLRAKVEIVFGQPVPPEGAAAEVLRARVVELGSDRAVTAH